jgi:glycerol uptake facilitator protein
MPIATMAELVAEVLGTAAIMLGGSGVVATVSLFSGPVNPALGAFYIALGWGFSVAFAILISFDISGAHLNPAVTLAGMIVDGQSRAKGLAFIGCQFVGALLGAALVAFMFGMGTDIGQWFHTGPARGVSFGQAFVIEMVITAMLLLGIKSAASGKPPAPNKFIIAGTVGSLITFIGMTLGQSTGYAMNPARDFAPRLLYALIEGSMDPFRVSDNYFFVPLVAPVAGACLGSYLHKSMHQSSLPEPSLPDRASVQLTAGS